MLLSIANAWYAYACMCMFVELYKSYANLYAMRIDFTVAIGSVTKKRMGGVAAELFNQFFVYVCMCTHFYIVCG